MYKIGELSKLCKLPIKTLRFYDSEGLLIPDEIDRFTGYRYYSAARLADCNRIMAFKELGFTLDEIKAQLRSDKTTDTVAMIDIKIAELKDAILHRQTQLLRLQSIKEIISEGDNLMYDVIIKDVFCKAFLDKVAKFKIWTKLQNNLGGYTPKPL